MQVLKIAANMALWPLTMLVLLCEVIAQRKRKAYLESARLLYANNSRGRSQEYFTGPNTFRERESILACRK